MTNSLITKWDKKGIWARCNSFQDYSGEWNSELRIYLDEREITCLGEGNEFFLEGDFDIHESKELDKDGCPLNITSNRIELTRQDLHRLLIILDYWLDEVNNDIFEEEK
jgi:hypothetical protein